MIPQDDHPEINFVGLLIGPRGNTLKTLEKEVRQNICVYNNSSSFQAFPFVLGEQVGNS